MTADGSKPLQLWYKVGADGSAPGFAPTGADIRNINVQKIICTDTLRASATCTKDQWDAVKPTIRQASNRINSDIWGDTPVGYWLALPPLTRTLDSLGLNLYVQLDFLGNERLWYPTGVYRDTFGNIPQDIDDETALGLPNYNSYAQGNGIARYSIYKEIAFSGIYGFVPD